VTTVSGAYATRYYVNDGLTTGDIYCTAIGAVANSGLTPALPKATLGAAITAATAGDTIYIDAGTWTNTGTYTSINFNINKSLIIIGAGTGNTIFTGNASVNRFATIAANNVTIKNMTLRNYYANNDGQVITMSGRTGIVLENLILKDNPGNATSGVNIEILSSSNCIIRNCLFSCSGWNSDGGGTILANSSTVKVSNCIFKQVRNFADRGGAIEIEGATSIVTVDGCTFDECSARSGGAIYQNAGSLTVNASCFQNNFTAGDGSDPNNGGAAYSALSSIAGTICSFTNCSFSANYVDKNSDQNASCDGGAFLFRGSNATFTINKCSFNDLDPTPSNYDKGQDFYISGASATGTITNSTFGSSTNANGGNKVNIYVTSAGSVTVSNSGSPTYTGAITFTNNTVSAFTPTAVCASSNLSACGVVPNCATDPNPPVIVQCAPDTTITDCSVLPDYRPLVVAYDDCAFTITQSPAPGTVVSNGVILVTMTVSDQSPVSPDATCTFNVTVSGCVGCIAPAAPTVNTTQPTCSIATGIIVVTAPIGLYEYNIDGGTYQASTTFSGVTVGSHIILVRRSDDITCISAGTSVTINAQPVTPTAPVLGGITQPTCFIGTGSVDLSGLPASGLWTVTVTPGGATTTGTGTTITFAGLSPGTYTFTVTNSDGCTSAVSATSATINIQPGSPSAPVMGTVTQPTCLLANGSVDLSGLPTPGTWTVTATPGGTTLTGTGTTAIFAGLTPNTYTFNVTNSSGCNSAASSPSITINAQPVTPSAPILGTVTQPTCAIATGSVAISGLPVSGTWTITATPGSITTTGTGTTAIFIGLNPNTYTFTVTNSDGCTSAASSTSAIINTQPVTPLAPVVGAITQPTCFIGTGSVDLSGLPASGLWTVTATPGGATSTGTGTTITFAGLAPGTYTFTVTNSVGCTSAASATSATINIQPGSPSAPVTGTVTQPTCLLATGTVDLSGLPTPGTWTITATPGGSTTTGTGITATFSGLVPNTYTFTVTNSLGCTSAGSSPSITINAQPVTPSAPIVGSVTQPTCTFATGSIDLSGLPASGVWTVTATPGGTIITGTFANATFSNLTPNVYTFTITNSDGCTSVASSTSATINAQPVTPSAPILGTITQPTCAVAIGSVDLSGLPAAGSWTVTATPGGAITTGTGTTATFAGLAAGTYTFTVTNSDGCTSAPSATSATINAQPVTPTSPILGTVTQPTCALATGGVDLSGLPATGTWTVTATPGGITTTGTGTTATFAGLAAGTYTFTVTNSDGCTSAASATSATINAQPVTPTAPILGTVTQPTCVLTTGSVDLSGLPTAGSWTVTATPGGAITNGTGTTATFVGLAAGTYTFTVTNSDGCTSAASATSATINAQPVTPTAPILGTVTQPTCSVATGSVVISGLPASGSWTVTATPGGAATTGTGTTATFAGLAAGTYTFTVTNSDGCTSAASATSATINAQPVTPTAPILGTVTQPTCSVAIGSVVISGLPASGSWTVTATPGGATNTGIGTTATFAGLAAGTYTFTITNSNGCTSAASATSATINAQPVTPTAPILGTVTQPTCSVATGSVFISGLPASGSWIVTATPGGATTTGIGTTATFGGLAAGTYTFTVTNSDGCNSAASATSATINAQPVTPIADITGSTPICEGQSTTITATGGGNYLWNTGDTAAIITDTPSSSTIYSVTVTNSSGCTASDDFQIIVNPIPTVDISSDPADMAYLGQVVTFTASPSGYDQYDFFINNIPVQSGPGNTYQTSALTSGQNVTVLVTDNGCLSLADSTIDFIIRPIPNAFTPDGNGKNDLFAPGVDLTILNRWDQVLYKGFDGWNGKYNDKMVSPGSYYYIIRIADVNTEIKEYKGALMLVGK
jgi:hypothetical protein